MSQAKVEMVAFKLNDKAPKAELNDYAIRRGFLSIGALARFALYCYLDKVHYPYKASDEPETGENKKPQEQDIPPTA